MFMILYCYFSQPIKKKKHSLQFLPDPFQSKSKRVLGILEMNVSQFDKRMETTSAAFELRPKVNMRGAKRRQSAWKTCDGETQVSQTLHSSSFRTAPPIFPAPEPMPWKTPPPSGLTWGTGGQEHHSRHVSWCGPHPSYPSLAVPRCACWSWRHACD